MSAPTKKKKPKSLKDRAKGARFAYRDVPISMDGESVIERERALARILKAGQAVQAAEAALKRRGDDEVADGRMGQKPAEVIELEQIVADAQAELDAARAEVEELEQAMREDMVVLRFTALKKDRFRELQGESDDAAALYSALARESGKHVNEDSVDDIDAEVWELLEEGMTAGQWQEIVEAIDEVNITLAGQQRSFLGRGSTKTQS